MCGLMVSLFVCADIGPRPPPGHRRRVVTIAPSEVPAGSSYKRWWDMDGVLPYLEWLSTGVSDDGWKHLSSEMIVAIHNLPPEWTGVMRKMDMACEHFRRATRGDLPAKDESSEEDDDIKSDNESKSD